MDDREILEELRSLAPRRAPAGMGERVLQAGRARAARIRARRRGRIAAAAAACLVLYFAAWGPEKRAHGSESQGAPGVVARSLLVETEARKALLEARISRLERWASSIPGKSSHLKLLKNLRRELDCLVIPSSLPVEKKKKEKKDNKKSWIPRRNGGLRHV